MRGHGHRLRVQSQLNVGSLFTFELKLSKLDQIDNAA